MHDLNRCCWLVRTTGLSKVIEIYMNMFVWKYGIFFGGNLVDEVHEKGVSITPFKLPRLIWQSFLTFNPNPWRINMFILNEFLVNFDLNRLLSMYYPFKVHRKGVSIKFKKLPHFRYDKVSFIHTPEEKRFTYYRYTKPKKFVKIIT